MTKVFLGYDSDEHIHTRNYPLVLLSIDTVSHTVRDRIPKVCTTVYRETVPVDKCFPGGQ